MKIFLDLDGNISNFCKAASNLHNKKYDYSSWPDERMSLQEVLNLSNRKFWKPIDEAGYKFWANLELFPWSKDLFALAKFYDKDFHLLTSPSRSPDCCKGKMCWIQKHLGWGFRNYIFAPAKSKQMCSVKDRVLVDDKPSNIAEWNKMGGTGILFPQPWNTKIADIPEDRIKYLSDILEDLSKNA